MPLICIPTPLNELPSSLLMAPTLAMVNSINQLPLTHSRKLALTDSPLTSLTRLQTILHSPTAASIFIGPVFLSSKMGWHLFGGKMTTNIGANSMGILLPHSLFKLLAHHQLRPPKTFPQFHLSHCWSPRLYKAPTGYSSIQTKLARTMPGNGGWRGWHSRILCHSTLCAQLTVTSCSSFTFATQLIGATMQ